MAETPTKSTVCSENELRRPLTSDTILEVRVGRMKPLRGLKVESGIDKTLVTGPIKVTKYGLEGDEHDPTFHGGVDKAVHGYCSSHYPTWSSEFPTATESFVPGGFGENFVTAFMNERNICIGDIYSVQGPASSGPSSEPPVLLQISLPRQPCFKLNHRFQLKNFAPNTWKTSRTGWYFRVLREGQVQAGDTIRLVERKHPEWTIERIQEYLHRNPKDAAMNEALARIDEFGAECKDSFRGRVTRQKAQDRKAAARAEKGPKWRGFRVVEKKAQTPRITSFVFEAVEPLTAEEVGGDKELLLQPGAHAKIRLGNGLVRAYSIVDGDRNRFQLAIALEEKSRGGSRYMHEEVEVGHVLQVGTMTVGIPAAAAASQHIFVAGGVGITAFLSLAEFYKSIHYSVVLHYAVRSADEIPFKDRLDRLGSEHVHIYSKAGGRRLDVHRIINDLQWNSQLYFCGPKRLMEEAAKQVKERGIAEKEVHFEAFEADISGDPFEAVVANKEGVIIRVGEEETLLECLQKQFDEIDSSCSVGNCGTCRIDLQAGRVDHRGTALTEEEKATSMLSCVSRGVGRITISI